MSKADETLTIEDIQSLPTTNVPEKQIFIKESRKLYSTMLKSIPSASNKPKTCMELLKLAEIIYTTERNGCCAFDINYSIHNWQTSFYCGQNVKRILDSIKVCKMYGIEIKQYNPIQRSAIMKAINEQYSCRQITTNGETHRECSFTDVPEVVNKLKMLREKLKKDREEKDREEPKKDKYFQEQCKELVEFKEVPGSHPLQYTILLHSGFQKRVLGIRPGPSPISSDTDGVFICRLREAIVKFLEYYNISYKKSERFAQFEQECNTAVTLSTQSASPITPVMDQNELNFAAEIAVYLMENPNELRNLQDYISESTEEPTEDSKPITNANFEKFFSEVVSSKDEEPPKFNSRDRKKQQLDYAKTKLTEMEPEEVTAVITKCSLWLLGFNDDYNPTKDLVERTYKSKITNSTTQQLLYLLGQARDTLISVEASSLKRQGGGYKRNKTKRNRKAYKTIRRNNKNKNKNKKQYRRKRHTKKYKKSHHKSRR
jgi:hypothetical protein